MLSQGPPAPEPAGECPSPVLLPFCFWWQPPVAVADPAHPAALPPPSVSAVLAEIRAHLATQGWAAAEPLRWAITAVEPGRGLQLEGVALLHTHPSRSRP